MIPKKLTHFDAYVDGYGHAGLVTEVEPPKLALKMEEHRAGGMDTPMEIDLGTEKLEATLTMGESVSHLFGLWGIIGDPIGLSLRASQGQGNAAEAVIIELRGTMKEIDEGSWKAGDPNSTKYAFACTYYRKNVGGKDLVEIDVENMVRKINGVDQLARVRQNLGR